MFENLYGSGAAKHTQRLGRFRSDPGVLISRSGRNCRDRIISTDVR